MPLKTPVPAPADTLPPDAADSPARDLDRLRESIVARLTAGLSPEALTLAWADWAIHLAGAPGKRLELMTRLLQPPSVPAAAGIGVGPGPAGTGPRWGLRDSRVPSAAIRRTQAGKAPTSIVSRFKPPVTSTSCTRQMPASTLSCTCRQDPATIDTSPSPRAWSMKSRLAESRRVMSKVCGSPAISAVAAAWRTRSRTARAGAIPDTSSGSGSAGAA